ncbi:MULTISPECIES: FAD-dependent oxidoreductase [Shouchella]|uniref:NAD(P)/FAD-dependent oxidoreductase n=2 Tax=Shouchella TaxID=2893057 RepID=A0ABY7W3V6_9BACI|nr:MULTISPECIES: NAD(P)/FAD-dependent oxidoreductase [Shouchella]MED4127152.1 NAD(P)/FAD-dependent oxidoreductase [Shouchella miscanthi]WDF03635.1 NAD(P)/FAD-dependent oxidoreductase [Shouchella hunanensis]
MKTQVLIVGGGVAGLTAALKLAKHGINVIVVEKSPHLGHAYKGELIQPKTIQLFERAGIYESFSSAWTTFSTIETSELDVHLKPMLRSSMDYKQLPPPYQYAAMLPHSEIKRLLLKEVKQYKAFTLLQPATFEQLEENKAIIKQGKQKTTIAFEFIIGAEGVNSRVREQAGIERKRHVYEHDFLTVSFPAPSGLKHGHLIATKDRFLGLFPLPNGYVRTVYLIRKGEYKTWRKGPLQVFYDHYVSLFPALDGYVQNIKEWKAIQLMVPIRQHANHYVKDNIALIGDAAHSVHPMAGEGMNLAIQGADCLGELLIDLYERRKGNAFLNQYESVHKKRVKAIMNLSHLGGLAYGKEGKAWQRSRTFALKQLLNNETLLTKYMFNISGLGFWPFSVKDSVTLVKRSKTTKVLNEMEQYQYDVEDDYPWKHQMR